MLQDLDQDKVKAFEQRMLGVLNTGALALMTSLGHRTGLFDVMGQMPASTSEEIASRAELNERYVREWLGAMVTGALVEYSPQRKTYFLPPEHAASLTRAASPNNLASVIQWIPHLAQVEEEILACFRHGGGVPYEKFHRFHDVMAEESGQTVLTALLSDILPLAPGMTAALEKGIDVLDIGCGQGRAVNLLAQKFPRSRFTGYDLCEDAIATARKESQRLGLKNARFQAKDLTLWEEAASFDLITAFDAIHDQAQPARVLRNIATALRPGGTYLMQDIAASSHLEKNLDHPIAPMLYTISCMHCMTVSLAQGGAGLGTVWGIELAQQMLREAGFRNVRVERLKHDIQNCYYIAGK